jgi:probable HAF family extracellular repeat protein
VRTVTRSILWILLLVLAASGASAQARFDALPLLPVEDAEAFASGVSGDGSVVVGSSAVNGRMRAVRWKVRGLAFRIARLSSRQSYAASVSHDGSTIVGAVGRRGEVPSFPPDLDWRAARWTRTGAHLVPLGKGESWITDVSANGSVACGSSGSRAAIWKRGGKARTLGSLPIGDDWTQAEGISGDGRVVVGTAGLTGTEAFRWTEETGLVGLGALPGGALSRAEAVSADGEVVVGSSQIDEGSWEAFVWTEAEGMVGIGHLPGGGLQSSADAVSGDGSRVAGNALAGNQYLPFLWDAANGMRRLDDALTKEFGIDLTGWEIESVAGFSDDGTVLVGTGILFENDVYRRTAWRAVIPAL